MAEASPVGAGRWWVWAGALLIPLIYLPSLATRFDFIDDGSIVYPTGPLPLGEHAEVVTITRGNLRTIACPGDEACPVWPQAAQALARKGYSEGPPPPSPQASSPSPQAPPPRPQVPVPPPSLPIPPPRAEAQPTEGGQP